MNEKLGDRLKKKRSLKKLGLRETANLVGISATYLSRIENNVETSPPSEEKIRKLSEILDDDFDELMRLADRVPTEVADLIKSDANMPAFLRKARQENISAEELLKMIERRKASNK